MNRHVDQVARFMIGANQKFDTTDNLDLRLRLMKEEMDEVEEAIVTLKSALRDPRISSEEKKSLLVHLAKELADLSVVTIGSLLSVFGARTNTILEVVDSNNLTKVPFKKNADGKVIKPEGYVKVDLSPFI